MMKWTVQLLIGSLFVKVRNLETHENKNAAYMSLKVRDRIEVTEIFRAKRWRRSM